MGLEEKLRRHVDIVVEDACYEVIEEPVSIPKATIYVIYTEKSGPTKWTLSRDEAIDYVSKHRGSKYKATKAV